MRSARPDKNKTKQNKIKQTENERKDNNININ